MAWEYRNGYMYYYRKHRIGGRVVSEYIGNGEFAWLIYSLDQLQKRKNQAEQRLRRDFFQVMEMERDLDREIDQICEMIRINKELIFRYSGYHSHKGQWRKKRNAR